MTSAHSGVSARLVHEYHEVFGRHHGRFALIVLLLVVLVASYGVPYVIAMLQGLVTYDLGPYEPKDLDRAKWLDRHRHDVPERSPDADR